ncbi:hypothetical protein BGW80DRAFT_1263645, partial [Lactifluus volemus]
PPFCHQSAVRVRHLGNTVRPLLACNTITAGPPYCCRPASLLERYGHRYVTSSMHSANTKCIYDCVNNTRRYLLQSLTHHLPLAGALGFHGKVKACLGSCLTLVNFVCVVQSAGSIHLPINAGTNPRQPPDHPIHFKENITWDMNILEPYLDINSLIPITNTTFATFNFWHSAGERSRLDGAVRLDVMSRVALTPWF